MEDMEAFNEIADKITKIATDMEKELQKKKKTQNINSKNEIEQEKST
jgi:Ribonuclease G/E